MVSARIFFRLSIAGERFRGTCAGEGKPCRCVQTISMLLQILLMISLIFLILQVRPSNNKIIANIDDNISDIAGPPEPVTNGVDSLSLSLLSLFSIFSLSSRSMAEVFPGYQTLLPFHWFLFFPSMRKKCEIKHKKRFVVIPLTWHDQNGKIN